MTTLNTYAAGAVHLGINQIQLKPSIRLIYDNIQMGAAFDNGSAPLSTLRITYYDLLNMTEGVRFTVYTETNNTPWYSNLVAGSSNITITINNVNTSQRYSVHYSINHTALGNSPIEYTVGVGAFGRLFNLGLPASLIWLYDVFAFAIVLFTAWIITPENRLPGYLLLTTEIAIVGFIQWIAFQNATIVLFVAFMAGGIIYEIRRSGLE
jgi:hypothetical protein